MAGGARESGRSVVARALDVLAAFESDGHPSARISLNLSQISARTGLALSTAHRVVAVLVEWGALDRTESGFVVGRRLWRLGQAAPANLRDSAHPWLLELFRLTGENVHLAVLDGHSALYIDKIHGRHAVPIISKIGGQLPLHTTGVGKALLAMQSMEFIEDHLARSALAAPTRYSITDPAPLRRELAEIRKRGLARTHQEMTLGSCSLAAPVIDAYGRAVAAIGVVVSVEREDQLDSVAGPLLDTARQLGRLLEV